MNLPLDTLAREVGKLDPKEPVYVLCQGGYRSSLATSILENAGFREIYNVTGGTKAWMDAGFDTDVSATACATSKRSECSA
jgi:hydroxyacylglutathione hydrolase